MGGALRSLRLGPAVLVIVTLAALVAPPALADRPWRPKPGAAEKYIRSRQGFVSFAAINENGRMWGRRRHRPVEAMSVFKAMLLVTYLRMGSVRGRNLRGWERGLLGPMIKWSDTPKAYRVRDIVGHRRIRELARDANMLHFRQANSWGYSLVTARDQARFFFNLKRYLPTRHEDYARYLLSHVVHRQRWGMASYVDKHMKRWRFCFKGGWGSATGRWSHQVAYFKKGNRRLALAIMTEDSPNHSYANRTMRGVARRLLRSR